MKTSSRTASAYWYDQGWQVHIQGDLGFAAPQSGGGIGVTNLSHFEKDWPYQIDNEVMSD